MCQADYYLGFIRFCEETKEIMSSTHHKLIYQPQSSKKINHNKNIIDKKNQYRCRISLTKESLNTDTDLNLEENIRWNPENLHRSVSKLVRECLWHVVL